MDYDWNGFFTLFLLHIVAESEVTLRDQTNDCRLMLKLRLVVCLLDQNRIVEARRIQEAFEVNDDANRRGRDGRGPTRIATLLELRWRYAQTLYKYHFFGYDGYRAILVESIRKHLSVLSQSSRILGEWHPLTLGIAGWLHTSLREQLDWSLDDMPADVEDGVRENFRGSSLSEFSRPSARGFVLPRTLPWES